MKTFIITLSVLASALGGNQALATESVLSPDLAPVSVAIATNLVAFYPPSPQSPTVSVTCVVTNEGPVAAVGVWDDVISISTNGTTNGIIGYQEFWSYYWDWSGVPSGGTYDETDSVSLPEQSGTYWLIFQVNAGGDLFEADTNNNTMMASVPVTVSYQVVAPDLAPLSVAVATNRVAFYPPSPQAPTVSVTCIVTNEGMSAAVGYWYDTISISTNGAASGIISSQAFWNYFWNSPGVPTGGTYDETDSVSLPEQSGTYWLIFQANANGYIYEADTNNNTMVASVPVTVSYQVVPPDLAPLSVEAASNHVSFYPSSPQAPTVPVTCVVANKGRGTAAGYWSDRISVSTNATTNGIISSQYFGQYQNAPGVPPGGAYRETDTVSLPQQSGRYWLIFQANAESGLYETNTGNNTMIAPLQVQVSFQVVPPDLAPLSVVAATNRVAFYPPSPQPPTVSVTCVASNQGRGAAVGFWYDMISISTNATSNGIIGSQEFWQDEESPGVPFGETYHETNVVSLPQQSGRYWLIFQANAYGYLYEADATNNTITGSTPVTVTYQVVPPDLAPVSVAPASNNVAWYPASPQSPSIPVVCTITNEGLGAASGNWMDSVYVSTDGTLNGVISSAFFYEYWSAPGVLPGGAYQETNYVTLPQQSGAYWLIFQANVDGDLYEADTTNNTLIGSVPVNVTYAVVPPDLTPLSVTFMSNSVTFDPTGPQSPNVPVVCLVTNEGLGAAMGYWNDLISVSTNRSLSGIVSSENIWEDGYDQALPPGGAYQQTNYVSLPQQSGTYWVIYQANADNGLYEPNTNNNTMIGSAPVTLSYQVIPPDLAPVSVTTASNYVNFDPASPQAPTVPVTCVVTNEGLGTAAGDCYDMISISTNGTTNGIISSQGFWQYFDSPGISSGGTYDETNVVSLPEQSGTYWLIFQANAYGDLYETDTTNNTVVASVPVTVSYQVIPPDLAPVRVTAASNHVNFDPASPQPPTIPVICVVTNQGPGPASGGWEDVISISTNGATSGIISSQGFWQYQYSPGVFPDGTYAETNVVSLPEQSGTYWLILQANAGGDLYEADTTNNTMVGPAPVTVSYQVIPPDLATVSVTAASNQVAFYPPSPQAPTVPVTCVVANRGRGTA
jgi:hypothetical protein